MEQGKLEELLKERKKEVYERVKCCINWLIELGNKVESGTESEGKQAILEFLGRTFMITKEQHFCHGLGFHEVITLYTFYLDLPDLLPLIRITPYSMRINICHLEDEGVVEEARVVCEWEWELPPEVRALIIAVTKYISMLEEQLP